MNKYLWYANSTGGVPYTYGEVFFGEEICRKCQGKKRVSHLLFIAYLTGVEWYVEEGDINGRTLCPECKGKGFNRRLLND